MNNIFTELLDSRLLIVGSPTVNRNYLSVLSPFLDDLTVKRLTASGRFRLLRLEQGRSKGD